MGILRIISHNIGREVRTRKPDDLVPYPADFRGRLLHDPDRCVGCEICAYVCSPSAITFAGSTERTIAWEYFAEQCTFCGRCVDFCPSDALSFAREAPVVTGDRTEHRIVHHVPYQTCARCGKPVLPMPEEMLAQYYGGVLPSEVADMSHLCDVCRRRVMGERIKRSFTGE